MRALSEKRLSDYMAQQIADEILSGRIVGGTQLKQEELAEVFGASRIPIREAFQVLEGQGLIVRLATRRIYAVELSEEQIQIIYEIICFISSLHLFSCSFNPQDTAKRI